MGSSQFCFTGSWFQQSITHFAFLTNNNTLCTVYSTFIFRQFKNRNPHIIDDNLQLVYLFINLKSNTEHEGSSAAATGAERCSVYEDAHDYHAVTQTCSLQMTNKTSDWLNSMMNFVVVDTIMSANNSPIPTREWFCLLSSLQERTEVRDTTYWEGCKLDFFFFEQDSGLFAHLSSLPPSV